MTKKSELNQIRNKEKRESRIKETRNKVKAQSFSSLMNNQKWHRVFEFVEQHGSKFELKTLLSSRPKESDQILELEKSSILMDHSGEFIEFLELEFLVLENTTALINELEKFNIDYCEHSDFVKIFGYRK
ncbi:MAG: DUF6678 family protein [Flavobacteriales bacterium]